MIADFVVIGGGIIGLTIARELKLRYPDGSVILLEKEPKCGQHASGRNSGILHAGFYYSPDSLKARFTRDGNRLMTDYCAERGVPIIRCGKLVVARREEDLPRLEELFQRGQRNGVSLQLISEQQAREIEPRVKARERALFSPTTSCVDPSKVIEALLEDVRSLGVRVRTGSRYIRSTKDRVVTTTGDVTTGFVVNAAGLYADRVAKDFGFAQNLRIVPFKGLYLSAPPGTESLNTNVYPVPDPNLPFLGVHASVTASGAVLVGPSAIPALWRESYGGMRNFSLSEFWSAAKAHVGLFSSNTHGYRNHARRELPNLSARGLVTRAAELVEGLNWGRRWEWSRTGVRAQLVDIKRRELVMDFVVEGDRRSIHVLNAVSPAFTSSMAFSEHVVDEIERLTS